jgi:hypothetical protein
MPTDPREFIVAVVLERKPWLSQGGDVVRSETEAQKEENRKRAIRFYDSMVQVFGEQRTHQSARAVMNSPMADGKTIDNVTPLGLQSPVPQTKIRGGVEGLAYRTERVDPVPKGLELAWSSEPFWVLNQILGLESDKGYVLSLLFKHTFTVGVYRDWSDTGTERRQTRMLSK